MTLPDPARTSVPAATAATPEAILIVGAGLVGAQVARRWLNHARATNRPLPRITLWTRSVTSARMLAAEGFTAEACDIRPGATSSSTPPLPVDRRGYDRVIFRAAPEHPADARALYVDGYRRVLEALATCHKQPLRLVLAGSTGVIGDAGGAAVDESAPRDSSNPRAQVLCDCEDLFTQWVQRQGQAAAEAPTPNPAPARVVIARLVGLYGPSRNPLAALKAGTYRYPRDPHRGINQIHIADAAAALVQAGQLDLQGNAVEIIHLSDGQFPTRREYIEAICAAYDLKPPSIEATPPEKPGARAVGDRRILNAKMRRVLLPELAFPTCREGIASFENASTALPD